MDRLRIFLVLFSVLLAVGFPLVAVARADASEHLVWEGDVYSSGVPVISAVLESGSSYRIVAEDAWFYNNASNLAADAQYFTTSSVDSWEWYNYYRPAGDHSFLQIDGNDVEWGAFSNGDTNHTYSVYYAGKDGAVTFRIVDWVDQNYGNNFCHLHVSIYEELTVGGRVVDSSPSGAVIVFTVGALLLASVATVAVIVHRRKT